MAVTETCFYPNPHDDAGMYDVVIEYYPFFAAITGDTEPMVSFSIDDPNGERMVDFSNVALQDTLQTYSRNFDLDAFRSPVCCGYATT